MPGECLPAHRERLWVVVWCVVSGSAKDLVETDLNGPEFVGTAEYMSPEAMHARDAGKEA